MGIQLDREKVIVDDMNWHSWYTSAQQWLRLTSDIVIGLSLSQEIKVLSAAAEEHYHWDIATVRNKNYRSLCQLANCSLSLLTHLDKIIPPQPLADIQEIIPVNSGRQVINWQGEYLFSRQHPFGLIIVGKKNFQPLKQMNSSSLQQCLESMIEAIPGSFYCKDKQGVYLLCNNVVLQKGNLKSKADIIGLTDYDVWPEHAENIRKNDIQVIENDDIMEMEETIVLPSGKTMYFASVKMPLRDENGTVIGIACNSLDVTELKQAKEKAEQANIIKTEFIHNMEHDIRTPFNGIYALANLLYEEEADIQKKEYLGAIAKSGKELLDFCNTILDFSKIDMGILPVLQNKFNLLSVIEKAITIEHPAIVQKKLTLIVNNNPDLPQYVIGDDYRLLRILLNLMGNSVKFTKEGSISLTTEVQNMNCDEVVIKFTIQDTGIGIAKDKFKWLYEKFTRLADRTNDYKGFGLGLRIVKQFIDELHGEISVISELNKGTSISFLLPFSLSEKGNPEKLS